MRTAIYAIVALAAILPLQRLNAAATWPCGPKVGDHSKDGGTVTSVETTTEGHSPSVQFGDMGKPEKAVTQLFNNCTNSGPSTGHLTYTESNSQTVTVSVNAASSFQWAAGVVLTSGFQASIGTTVTVSWTSQSQKSSSVDVPVPACSAKKGTIFKMNHKAIITVPVSYTSKATYAYSDGSVGFKWTECGTENASNSGDVIGDFTSTVSDANDACNGCSCTPK